MGYKTCHVLNSSLDATVCAKDCDRLKKEDFAKQCNNRGGLYKCCIRRDTAFCHECRYLISIKQKNSQGLEDMHVGVGFGFQKFGLIKASS